MADFDLSGTSSAAALSSSGLAGAGLADDRFLSGFHVPGGLGSDGSATFTPNFNLTASSDSAGLVSVITAVFIPPLILSGSSSATGLRTGASFVSVSGPAGAAPRRLTGTSRLPTLRSDGDLANGAFYTLSQPSLLPALVQSASLVVGSPPVLSGTSTLRGLQQTLPVLVGSAPVLGGTSVAAGLQSTGVGNAVVFSFDLYARRPIAVDQPPLAASNYPFLNAQPDSVMGDIVADLAVLLPPSTACQFKFPFRLAWMSGFGDLSVAKPPGVPNPRYGRDVLILDADGQTVFNTAVVGTTYRTARWDTRLEVTEWLQPGQVLRVVHNVAWTDLASQVSHPSHIVPTGNSDLDPRTIHFKPAYLERLLADGVGLKGDVILEEGYNTSLVVGEPIRYPSGLQVTPITINSIPGAGLGAFGGCEESAEQTPAGFRTIGGVSPGDRGNFLFNGSECFRIERTEFSRAMVEGVPTISFLPGFTFNMDCQPCCPCESHVRVHKAIKRVWDRARVISQQAIAIRDLHQANIERWSEQAACRANDRLKVILVPWCSGSVSVAASYCNNQDVCLGALNLEFCFSLTNSGEGALEINPQADIKIPCGTGFAETTYIDPGAYTLGGGWPCFTAQFEQVEPLSSAAVRFQLSLAAAKLGENASLSLTVRAGSQVETVSCSLIRGRP